MNNERKSYRSSNFSITRLLLSLLASSLAVGKANSQDESCNGVLELAGRDVSLATRDLAMAEYAYSQLCQASTLKKDSNFSAGISGVVESLPVSLTAAGGTNKEKAERMCKTYNDWRALNYSGVNLNVTAVKEAITAWSQCKMLASASVFINIQLGMESLIASLRRGRENAEFRGLDYDSAALECSGSEENSWFGDGKTVVVNKQTRYSLQSGDDWAITCVRKPQTIPKLGTFFDATELRIVTSRGALLLKIPREEKYTPVYSSEIRAELARTAESLSRSEKTVAELQAAIALQKDTMARTGASTTAHQVLHWVAIGKSATIVCPDGQYAQGVGFTLYGGLNMQARDLGVLCRPFVAPRADAGK